MSGPPSAPPGQPPGPTGWSMPCTTSMGLPSEPPPPYTPGPQGTAYTVGNQQMPPVTKPGYPPIQPGQGMPHTGGIHYGYMQPMHNGTQQQPITAQPVRMVVLVPEQPADPRSKIFNCETCQKNVTSKVSTTPKPLAWATGIFLCLIGCDLGCCLIPCCIEDCMYTNHSCPECRQELVRPS